MSGTFSMVPHWLLERGASAPAVKLYAVLASYGTFDPSVGEYTNVRPRLRVVSDRMNGASDSALRRAMVELERLGALRRVQRRRPDGGQAANGYRVIFGGVTAPPWRAPDPLVEDDQTPPPPPAEGTPPSQVEPPPSTDEGDPPPPVTAHELEALDLDPETQTPPPPPSPVPTQRRPSTGGRDSIKQAIRIHLLVDYPDLEPAEVDEVYRRIEASADIRSVRSFVAAATKPGGVGLADWYRPVRKARLDRLASQRASMQPCPHGTPGGDQVNGAGVLACPMCRAGLTSDASRPTRAGHDASTPISRVLAAYSAALPPGRRQSAGQLLGIRTSVVRLLEAGAPESSLVDVAQRSARTGVPFDTLVAQLVEASHQEVTP